MMKEDETNKVVLEEEDKLLDPIAKSIVRDLEAAEAEEAPANNNDEHVNSDHTIPTTTTTDSVITIIKCDPDDIHCNMALEKDQDNSIGSQGGQYWVTPTNSPTPPPTSSPLVLSASPTSSPSFQPTEAPSYHPTLNVINVLRGTAWYDRNANGERDSNIDTIEMGPDVEYNYGLGGVTIQLMECDVDTNAGVVHVGVDSGGDDGDGGENNHVTAVSVGYDVLMHSKLVHRKEAGGTYNLNDIQVRKSYFIHVKAPAGYLFSGGVCNDNVPGWGCNYSAADLFAQGGNTGRGLQEEEKMRRQQQQHQQQQQRLLRGGSRNVVVHHHHHRSLNGGGANAIPVTGGGGANAIPGYTPPQQEVYIPPSAEELELGIPEGRSSKCITVDYDGKPDSHLDIGVMRIGDVSFDDTDVQLNLDLLKLEGKSGQQRSLLDGIVERILMDPASEPVRMADGTLAYVLKKEDKDAIGIVTSEVIASAIHESLKKKEVVLDEVSHIDVFYIAPEVTAAAGDSIITNSTDPSATSVAGDGTASSIRDTDTPRDVGAQSTSSGRNTDTGGKLSVELLVRGHYNRNLNVDFDYVIQDSINRDAHTIRRELTYYNQNCRDQTTKVKSLGFTLDDFIEVHTNRGVKKPDSRLTKRQQEQQKQEAAAEQAFSAACNQEKVLPQYFEESLGGLQLNAQTKGTVTYVVDEGGANAWAIVGGIIAVGVLALCFGYFMFRRGLNKKQTSQEVKVTHLMVEDDLDSIDEKIQYKNGGGDSRAMKERRKSGVAIPVPIDDGPTSTANQASSRRNFGGMVQREIGNMTAALNSERRRLAGGGPTQRRSIPEETARHNSMQSGFSDLEARLQNNLSDRGDEDVVLPPMMDNIISSATSGEEARLDEKNAMEFNHVVGNNSAMDNGISTSASCSSRKSVPKTIQVDLEDTESEEGESSDSSSSSDDDSSDSDSSSSSSSSEESHSSSQVRARKKREQRRSNKSKNKKSRESRKPKKIGSESDRPKKMKSDRTKDNRRKGSDLV
ncbi:hypothetical protein ACHAXR_010888 [Thalassiosira sp. AJA248-18]